NAASTQAQVITVDSVPFFTGPTGYESIIRSQPNGDQLNQFKFTFGDHGRIFYTCGQGGDGVFVHGTQANTDVTLYSGAGQDVFWIEGDQMPLLGPVYVNGNASQGDFAYYYDYFNAAPQTYAFRATPSSPNTAPNVLDQQEVQQSGGAV